MSDITTAPKPLPTLTDAMIRRFWSRVDVGHADACWNWASTIYRGYGRITVSRRNLRSHRVAYELLVGPIPDGMYIDHLCRNRACCNPAHMEPVTNKVNTMRGESFSAQRSRQTRCIHGHEFTPENTGINPNGCRRCLACVRIRNRSRSVRR